MIGALLCLAACALTTAAVVGNFTESKRMLVAAALLALFGTITLVSWIKQIKARKTIIISEALPLSSIGEHQLQSQFLELESRIEHAPIALFAVHESSQEVRPLNGNARRILAPVVAAILNNCLNKFAQIRQASAL